MYDIGTAKFVALFMAEDPKDFENMFRGLSQEDQENFVNFWADVQAAALRTISQMPLDDQIQALISVMELVPQDARAMIAQTIINTRES